MKMRETTQLYPAKGIPESKSGQQILYSTTKSIPLRQFKVRSIIWESVKNNQHFVKILFKVITICTNIKV